MSIEHAILGFLSWRPLTGYDLKKAFADANFVYWSGNNNQIYSTLIELQRRGSVTHAVEHPQSGPSRKVYTITGQGVAELRKWLLSAPEPPQLRNAFLIQLAWADQLAPEELDALLKEYEQEIQAQALMAQEQKRRSKVNPARTRRESLLWEKIADNCVAFYEHELAWVRDLRAAIAAP